MKLSIMLAVAPMAVAAATAAGQVVTDGSLGPAQNLAGPTYDITQGLGTTRGGNLFHSFSTFNLQAGETARFSGAGIDNVLARVTGGSASIIDGTLQSTIDGANLYFINPAGVIFGPNAALDVPGSFVATTADFVELEDGVRFGMQTPAAVLTSAPPASFGFLSSSPGPIGVFGSTLGTPDGQTLALVGGELRIVSAQLLASDGQLNLLSAASAGEVRDALSAEPVLDLPQRGPIDVRQSAMLARAAAVVGDDIWFGQTQLLTGSLDPVLFEPTLVDASGQVTLAESNIGTLTGTPAGQALHVRAGALTINADDNLGLSSSTLPGGRAGDIDIDVGDGPLIVLRGGQIYTIAALGGDGGDISIRAGTILMDSRGRDPLTQPVAAISSVPPGLGAATGQGGRIDIDTGDLILAGGQISASSIAAGDAKPIRIEASRLVHLREDAFINGQTGSLDVPGAGRGGDIEIVTPRLIVERGSISVSSLDSGSSGDIVIRANQVIVRDTGDISANIFGVSGPGAVGGSVDIEANTIEVRDRALISAATSAEADGGNVRLTATESILFDGAQSAIEQQMGSGILVVSVASGNAGNIELTAPHIELQRLAIVSADSRGAGDGGTILVQASDLLVIDRVSSIAAETSGSGRGGNIRIDAGAVQLDRLGAVSATSSTPARAGDVIINATGSVRLGEASQVTVAAPQGLAGDIAITAGEAIDLLQAQISAEGATGGNIKLTAPLRIALDDSTITAQAAGDGARISLDPRYVILNNSVINGLSAGAPVIVEVDPTAIFLRSSDSRILAREASLPPDADIAGDLVTLRTALVDASARLQETCLAMLEQISSFAVRGRGGLPPQPDGWWSSPIVTGQATQEDQSGEGK